MKKYLIMCGMVMTVWMTKAQEQIDAPLTGAQPPSFSVIPESASFLQNSVNLFTGQVQFSLPIATLAGKSGLSQSLIFNYSTSNVKEQSEIWNKEAPTGILGLGWSVDLPRIIVDNKTTGTREDDTFYLVEGGSASELFYDGMDGTEWKFYPKSYQFWKIRYEPSTETWTITKDNGIQYIYGDANSMRKTVQYIIKWGNWIGNSGANGQQQQADIWNLSKVIDTWGDYMTFEYDQLNESSMSVALHTKSSYLKEIKNSVGEQIVLSYGNKQLTPIIETVDPYSLRVEPDAYQENLEYKFLEKVTTYLSSGQVAETFQLSYEFIGTGLLGKRLLKSIQRVSSTGAFNPPVTFTYETGTGAAQNTGAMLQVTMPSKGTISFTYEAQWLPNSEKRLVIPKVANYYEPRFWLEDDYVVVSRRNVPNADLNNHSNGPQPVILDVYTWENGMWMQKSLGPDYATTGTLKGVLGGTISDNTDLKEQKFQLVTGKDFFAVLTRRGDIKTMNYPSLGNTQWARYDFDIFKRNPNLPGEWVQYHEEFQNVFYYNEGTEDYLSNDPKLFAGEDFVLIGGRHTLFKVYEWTGTTWGSWTGSISGSSHDHFYGCGNNFFIVHDENETTLDQIQLRWKNKANVWQTSSIPNGLSFNSEYSGANYWHIANTNAVVMADDNEDFIYMWDENYTNFTRYNINLSGFPNGAPVKTSTSMVTMSKIIQVDYGYGPLPTEKGYAFRYDGQSWRASGGVEGVINSLGIENCFSPGNDFVYTGKQLLYYDANKFSSFWSLTDVPQGLGSGDLAGHNFFVDGQSFYTVSNGVASVPNQFSSSVFSPKVTAGLDYLLWKPSEYESSYSFYLPIRNGGFPCIPIDLFGEHVNPRNHNEQDIFSPSNQTGSNSFITFFGSVVPYYMENAGTYILHRKVGIVPSGNLQAFIATRVTTFDGTATRYTSLAYDFNSATADASGRTFQFNKVTTVEGSDNASIKPNGSTETYFFNGKPSASLSAEASFPAMTSVSAIVNNTANSLNKFTGLPYKVVQRNSAGTIVSETFTDYYLYQLTPVSGQTAYYVKPWYNISKANGIKTQTLSTYHATTNQLKSEQNITVGTTGNTIQTLLKEYTYWWEVYDPLRSRNLLTPTVSMQTTLNGTLSGIASSRWTASSGGTPCQSDSYIWIGPSTSGWSWDPGVTPSANWKFTSKVNSRDASTGAVLDNLAAGDRFSATIWDETNRVSLAEVTNSSYVNVGYCGFEDSSKGNLSWNDGIVTSGNSKTGIRYFNLGTSGVSKNGLTSSITYKISFWAKTTGGSISVDGVSDNINLGTLVNWTLFEYEVKGVTALNIRKKGVMDVLIDDIRIHPATASMVTLTYNSMYGVTSKTDISNRTFYYEFDALGNLKLVRDDDNNIVQHMFKHIKE